jgi:hypothetical protein
MKWSQPKREVRLGEAAQVSMRVGAKSYLGLSLIGLLTAGESRVQEFQLSEYHLKAAFLFNLGSSNGRRKPREGKSPIVIGTPGESPRRRLER